MWLGARSAGKGGTNPLEAAPTSIAHKPIAKLA